MNTDTKANPITRLTALWALSESMLGGLLHAARIPFRGMILTFAAIIIMILIAHFANKKGEILKATILVLIVKAAVSPHTPVLAYGVVFLQGLMGELFFLSKRYFLISSIALGIMVEALTGLHRVITFTLVFGMTLWDALNEFINYAVKEFFFSTANVSSFNFSLLLVGCYFLIHVLFGIAAALFVSRLIVKLNSDEIRNLILEEIQSLNSVSNETPKTSKRKHWLRKPIYAVIFIISIVLLILSYLNPNAINLSSNSLLLMLFRAALVIIIWLFFLSPILLKFFKKLLHKGQDKYTAEINDIVKHLPIYKHIAFLMWRNSSAKKGISRINYFLTTLIVNVLTLKLPDE